MEKGTAGQAGYMKVEYRYNSEGLRIQKIVTETTGSGTTATTTDYILHGKNIVHMIRGNDKLHFFYDASNRPAIVEYNGTKYAYIHNLQGDIVGIIDSTGTEVVKYTYDAWGKKLAVTGTLAGSLGVINPFRYRGYVYDEETGVYYLRSRYFCTEQKRFVNSDSLIAYNVYAYCHNNPTNRSDSLGNYDYPTTKPEGKRELPLAYVAKKGCVLYKNSNGTGVMPYGEFEFGSPVAYEYSITEKQYTPVKALVLDERGKYKAVFGYMESSRLSTSLSVARYGTRECFDLGTDTPEVERFIFDLNQYFQYKHRESQEYDGPYWINAKTYTDEVKEAVNRFQKDMGLDVDGVAGKNTRETLANVMKCTTLPYSLRLWD